MSALGGNLGGAHVTQVRLRDIDPDFLRSVGEEERHAAGELALPALDLEPGPFDPHKLLVGGGASCGVIVSGMVNRHTHIGDQVALRVLGPGAVIARRIGISPEVITESTWQAAAPVRMALVGRQFLRAAAHWHQLQRSLIARFAEQNEQLAAQLALCQMPRVADRVLTMLWLLAESWGKVTSAGTVLPIRVTHEALGAMVGARRPTITLAVTELTESGALLQRPSGWLLLKSPPEQHGEAPRLEGPQLLELESTGWAREQVTIDDVQQRRSDLLALISRLREAHRQSVGELQGRRRRSEAIRERSSEIRDRVREERRSGAGRRPTDGEAQ